MNKGKNPYISSGIYTFYTVYRINITNYVRNLTVPMERAFL